jgi:transcriptional regulator with XRE-family HTH domain
MEVHKEDHMEMTEHRRSFGEVRRRQLLTVRDLSEKAGVSSKTVMDIEHGKSLPQLKTIRKLAEALEVDPLAVEEFAEVIEGPTKKAAA